MKTRTDILLAAHRNAHFCGELPRVVWYDDAGRMHYSIPSPRDKPARPGWPWRLRSCWPWRSSAGLW